MVGQLYGSVPRVWKGQDKLEKGGVGVGDRSAGKTTGAKLWGKGTEGNDTKGKIGGELPYLVGKGKWEKSPQVEKYIPLNVTRPTLKIIKEGENIATC